MALSPPIAGLATARMLRVLRVPDDAIRRTLVTEIGLTDDEITFVLSCLDTTDPDIDPGDPVPTPRLLSLPGTCHGCPGPMSCRCRREIHLFD